MQRRAFQNIENVEYGGCSSTVFRTVTDSCLSTVVDNNTKLNLILTLLMLLFRETCFNIEATYCGGHCTKRFH